MLHTDRRSGPITRPAFTKAMQVKIGEESLTRVYYIKLFSMKRVNPSPATKKMYLKMLSAS